MRAVWIILAVALVVSGLGTWRIISDMQGQLGDGRHAETYGFDLSNLAIPREELLGAGFPKDGVAALNHPPMLNREGLAKANAGAYGKYVLPRDLVIGVHIGGSRGESRAYPREFLMQHEIANDVVAGQAIAVTYNPLCDSVMVFDRNVDGAEREFGVSGLVYNSNLVMYDKSTASNGKESLWSQLQYRAIAGPLAKTHTVLKVLPCQMVTWGRWLEEFPDSLVMAKIPGDAESGVSYGSYFSSDETKFPLSPAWSDPALAKKTRVAAVLDGQGWKVFLLPELKTMPTDQLAGALASSRISYDPASATLWTGADDDRPVIYGFLFAFYAQHPTDAKYVPELPGKH